MTQQTPAPTSSDPASPFFRDMRREMGQLLDRFRGQPMTGPADFFDALSGPAFPAIDVVETADALEVTAEIPGVKQDDLDISISHNALVLKGEKTSEHEQNEQDYHLVERRYGSFRRQIALGFVPEADAVEARFADGVLKLTIAKPDEAKQATRKIEISNA